MGRATHTKAGGTVRSMTGGSMTHRGTTLDWDLMRRTGMHFAMDISTGMRTATGGSRGVAPARL